jgi:cephalosporin-C deacetylase
MSDIVPVRVERDSACYGLDEIVAYRIEAMDHDSELRCSLMWDGSAQIEQRRVTIGREATVLQVQPSRPGFVRLRVIDAGGTTVGEAAAAVTPERIAPSMPVPEDFDAFWESQLAPWRGAPLEADGTQCADAPGCRVEAIRLPTPAGNAIHAWLMRPAGPGPYPALVLYHGAGVYAVGPEHGQDWVRRGYMVFSINPHPIPNDAPPGYYAGLREGTLADYRMQGREARESLYFVPMFLRASLAVDFVASLPDWDRRHLHVEGHSHGGGQALAAAALNPRVTGVSVSCPTHCDHTGPVIGRVAGWPRIVEMRDGVPDPRHVEASRYIDGVNFASRIRCPALFGACFLDDSCPPTGIYAAFNALAGPRTMHHEPLVGHHHTDAYRDAAFRWAGELASRSRRSTATP